jgi:hypothetical protein
MAYTASTITETPILFTPRHLTLRREGEALSIRHRDRKWHNPAE